MPHSEQTTLRGAPPAAARRPPLQVPALTIASHPNPQRIGDQCSLAGLLLGEDVLLSRLEPNLSPDSAGQSLPIDDAYCSRRPIVLRRVADSLVIDPSGSPSALRVDGLDLTSPRSVPFAALDSGVVITLAGRVALVLHWAHAHRPARSSPDILGVSAAIDAVHQAIAELANEEGPVLIRGATGTGKELVARALHLSSRRRTRPFVAVNMGAIPASTAASELFGHRRGAFTGADTAQPGFFGAADSGTLFLDEIGETPLEVQPLLLRALEAKEIQPVGASAPRSVNVRLVSATDADLDDLVAAGRFRAALLFRLAGHVVDLPPLRARKPDIPLLLWHFLRQSFSDAAPWKQLDPAAEPWLRPEVMERLLAHDWPGNVRELRNLAQQLAATAKRVGRVELPELWRTPHPLPPPPPAPARALAARTDLQSIEDEQLILALRRNAFGIDATARELGISKNSLYLVMERSTRVRKAKDLTDEEIREATLEAGPDLRAVAARLEVSHRALLLRLKE